MPFINIDVVRQHSGIDLAPARALEKVVRIPAVAAEGVTAVGDVLALKDMGGAGAVASALLVDLLAGLYPAWEGLRARLGGGDRERIG